MKSVSQIELIESYLLIFIPGRIRPRKYKWTEPLTCDNLEEIIKIDESLQPGYTDFYTKLEKSEEKEKEEKKKLDSDLDDKDTTKFNLKDLEVEGKEVEDLEVKEILEVEEKEKVISKVKKKVLPKTPVKTKKVSK